MTSTVQTSPPRKNAGGSKPRFDFHATGMQESRGFTEDDLKSVLKGTEFEKEDLKNILFHCKNPGIVGSPKLCSSGCKDSEQEGSHSC
ncbi:unnamed protein product [Aspergillus oryzae]|nr:unnamed protein product [Aspergillus oryzae]